MYTIKEKKFSILPISLVILIDMTRIGIIIPILGPFSYRQISCSASQYR